MRYQRLLKGFLFIISLLLVVNLVRSTGTIQQRGDVLDEAQRRLEQEKAEQDNLVRHLAKVESSLFIEEQAREKLNLGREKEIIVLVPSISAFPRETVTPTVMTGSNWRQWIEVFW